jgi:toxin ParE1/3/4
VTPGRRDRHGENRAVGGRQGLPRSAGAGREVPQACRPKPQALTHDLPRIQLAPEVLADFDRFLDHQAQHGIPDTPERLAEIIDAIQRLAHSPLIGRKAKGGRRELVIGQASRGHVALHRFVADVDTVCALAIRNQRESGYKRSR